MSTDEMAAIVKAIRELEWHVKELYDYMYWRVDPKSEDRSIIRGHQDDVRRIAYELGRALDGAIR